MFVPNSNFKPSNPRDSKALAFVCTLEDKKHTIGYIIREVLELGKYLTKCIWQFQMVALFLLKLRGFATSLTGHVLGLGFLLESTLKYLGGDRLMLLHMPVPDKKLQTEHLIQLFHNN